MNQKIRIKLKSFDHNLVDKSAEKIVKTVKTYGRRRERRRCPFPRTSRFYGQPLDFRQQESPRAVPALHLQAHPRHLLIDAQDDRRADEARTSFGSRGRDQGVIDRTTFRRLPTMPFTAFRTEGSAGDERQHHFTLFYNEQLTTNVRTYWKENRNDFRLQCRG